jgi:hypothetical protein
MAVAKRISGIGDWVLKRMIAKGILAKDTIKGCFFFPLSICHALTPIESRIKEN